MEIEKAIEEFKELKYVSKDLKVEHIDLAIKALEKQLNSGWVSCKERLPAIKDGSLEYSELCLVTANIKARTYTYIAYYGSCNGFTGLFGGDWNNYVVAWQNLPDAWKRGSNEI